MYRKLTSKGGPTPPGTLAALPTPRDHTAFHILGACTQDMFNDFATFPGWRVDNVLSALYPAFMPRYSYCTPQEILTLQPGKLIALPPDPLPWPGWDGFYAWLTRELGEAQERRGLFNQAVAGKEAEKALRAWTVKCLRRLYPGADAALVRKSASWSYFDSGPHAFCTPGRKQLAFRERAILVFDEPPARKIREETWRNLPDFVREGLRR